MKSALFVPDLAGLQRKLDSPPPILDRLYARFRALLASDPAFRRHHIFLPALLGESEAIAEAKVLITTLVMNPFLLAHDQSQSSTATAQDSLDAHIWCVAPRAMRLAVYFTWLDVHGAWTSEERYTIGTAVLDFFHTYVVPVLRARTPGGHNQQFSMTFCCAVAGQAFAEVDGVAARAQALRDWTLPKFTQTLGLMPASGYSGEGSTYQSDVVSALVMWAGVFLEQLGEQDVWYRRWEPNGAGLADTLRIETAMGSAGGLLPPWDHYGWSRIHNLAARTFWAGLTGDAALLPVAETVWDEVNFIAWRSDDRLWTLLYWPNEEDSVNTAAAPVLTGWSLPAVGAAVEHPVLRMRAMCVWDRCSGNMQGVCRGQVNPNHLIIELNGEPVTADGWEDGRELLVSDASLARTLDTLTPVEQELLVQQYGSIGKWVKHNQHGFLGMACSIIVDGWESYFPRDDREGSLLFERREADFHIFTGESAAYYQPAFDVTRMRRTVAMNDAGIVWIVDNIHAVSAHDFTWRIWLRRKSRQTGSRRVQVDLPSGKSLTLAWAGEAAVVLTTVPSFPQGRGERYTWSDEGSVRCDLTTAGDRVRFVTCLIPEAVGDLTIHTLGPNRWEAIWAGGSARFELPEEIEAITDPAPISGEQMTETQTLCDLYEAPFTLLDEPDAVLLASLDTAPTADWAHTGAAMQTLVVRGNKEALPKIKILLLDPNQNYTVHSIAAWCLGHTAYAPALDALKRMSQIPEVNTAIRSRWAVERITAALINHQDVQLEKL